MIRLTAILLVLVLACLAASGYPAFAQGPPQNEDGDSSTVNNAPGISQILLASIADRNSGGGSQQGVIPRDTGLPGLDTKSEGVAEAGFAGKPVPGSAEFTPTAEDDGPDLEDAVKFDDDGNVEVYIHLHSTGEEALRQVRNAVVKVEVENTDAGIIQAWVDPEDLDKIASLGVVNRISPPDYGYTKIGSRITQGDGIHRANLVRALTGLTGEGVRIGVISDGANAMHTAQASGDLPSSIEVNPNIRGSGHEGTALMEIIHDLAPGADLAFSGYGSSLRMAGAILWLANDAFDGEGADVIVDDIGFYYEPFFEDGLVAQAAADAVDGGTVYVSSAGNWAERHYEGDFTDNGDGYHVFDGGSDIAMRVRTDRRYSGVLLQWNDQFGASANDYNLFVCPVGIMPTHFNILNDVCEASSYIQDGDDDPAENLLIGGSGYYDLYIKKQSGEARRLELFTLGGSPVEYGVKVGGIVGHPAVADVLAAGAIVSVDPGYDEARYYSDQGPSLIYFPDEETRMKPDVMGIDGVTVTGSGGFPTLFHGTSAAAPHVAAIAALLIEAQRLEDPDMTQKEVADEVIQVIRDTAVDIGETGHDNETGYGRADALAGVEEIGQLTATTFTVDSTGDGADSNSGDGSCDDGSGNCTLRAAIQEANAGSGGIIEFNISGSGARTIQPASELPTVTKTVFIDGFSQPGATDSNYLIELDGTNAGTNSDGLTISGRESWVRGLVINRFDGDGIVLRGSGKQVIEENRIGTNVAGTSDQGNGDSGISVSGAPDVVIQNNLISGNDSHGINISGSGASNAEIYRNIIGTNASEAAALGNGGSGVHISGGANSGIADNVISGNDSHGISLTSFSVRQTGIWDNFIGTARGGSTALGNSGSGVHIGGSANHTVVAQNTIANNSGDGITVVGNNTEDNSLQENLIYSNAGLGIDLGDDGVTANDINDSDSGPNDLQNFPVIQSAALNEDAASFTIDLDVRANNRYVVEFYANTSCDSSGNGEGREEIGFGSASSTTTGKKTYRFSTHRNSLGSYQFPTGTYITATATSTVLEGTSEFSACFQSTTLPELVTSLDSVDVTEGSTATYTVRLSELPSSEVTLNLSSSNEDAVTLSPEEITFTTGNGTTTQTVTVTGVADSDLDDEAASIRHSFKISDIEYQADVMQVWVEDDDQPELTFSHPTNTTLGQGVQYSGRFELTEGDEDSYSLALAEEPAGDVTVSIYGSTSAVVRVSPGSITFTKTGEASDPDKYEWDDPQTVTIMALEDSDIQDEATPVVHYANIDGEGYTLARLYVVARDSGLPNLVLSEDTLTVSEGGTATYTMVLDAAPSFTIYLVPVSSDTNAVTVPPGPFIFTGGSGGNWATAQTVTVTGVQDGDEFDDIAEIDHLFRLLGATYVYGPVVDVTVADSNRAPDFEQGAKITRSVPENSPEGTAVGDPVDAVDLNSDSLAYSISSQEGGPYTVDSSTGQIRVGAGATLDYESTTIQEVNLSVQDTAGLSDTIEVQVEITNVNEPPVVSGNDELDWQENRTGNITRYTATDPERDTFTWSTGGTDGSFFDIDSRGYLSFKAAPDHEASRGNEYNLTVVVTDSNSLAGEFPVKVTVTNVNEPPEVSGDTSITVDENAGTFSRTYSASDPEGATSTFTWSLLGTDGGDFNIDRNTGALTFRNTPNFESPADSNRNNEYLVTVRATDEGNLRGDLPVTITVNDVNEAPTISGNATLSYAENTATTRALSRYSATDPERRTLTWSIGGTDAGDFTIDTSGNLYFANSPDHENPADSGENNVYNLQVVATDDGNLGDGATSAEGILSASHNVAVTVTAVDEPPEISGDTDITVSENTDAFSRTYSASDPEGVHTTFTWSLSGTDGGDFRINRFTGEMSFRSPPDHESPADGNRDNEYLVTVRANDGQKTGSLAVTINVANVDEAPVFNSTSLGNTTFSFAENRTSSIYTYRAADPEGEDVTWSVSGTDAGDFAISQAGVLSFAATPDFELPVDSDQDNEYLVTVAARDPASNRATLDVTINVTNAPGTDEPTITTTGRTAFTFRENGTGTIFTFRARDPQGQPISWSLAGTDAGDFEISSSGSLTFASPPDFESPADSNGDNVYEVGVVATDQQGLTDRFNFTVTVTNDAESVEPTITTRRPPSTYPENRTSTVYTFRASDPQRQAIAWTLGGDDSGDFSLSATGVLTFQTPPDFESPADSDGGNDYDLTVTATDTDGNLDTLAFTITVADVNEGPEISPVRAPPSTVAENYNYTQLLATYTATDPEDATAEITRWGTSGTDGGDFVMNEDGELRFRNTPDYERPADSNRDNIYTFSVRAYDGRVYGYLEVTVEVTPVNEPPAITTTSTSATTLRQPENRTTRLYTYRATDPEGAATVTWSVGGTDARFFTISDRGEFSFDESTPPDYETPGDLDSNNVYEVTIQATDDDSNTASLAVTVTVTEVNEGPEVTGGGDSFSVQENSNWAGATFTARDPEAGSVTRWALGGRDGSDFQITSDGLMTFRRTPDFERPDDADRDNIYEVEVRPFDGRYYGSHQVTVTVADVTEITGTAALTRAENFEGTLATYTAGGRGDLAVTPAWRLTGTDGGDFTIDENGRLAFRNTPDHERPADGNRDNQYVFTVQASDDRYYDTLDVTVTVTAVNEPPTITTTSRTEFTQPENRATPLYTWRATDPEGSGTITWSLAGADARFFTITRRGEFSFAPASPPDFEARSDSDSDNIYEVTIQVSDDSSPPNSQSLPVTVTVTDVNEGPEITSGGSRFTVQENQDLSGASFTANDPEGGAVTRWSLGGRDGGDFTIDENGVLTFRNLPDYERPADSDRNNIYEVEVRPYDGRYYGSHHVTVTVTPINEAPEITTTSTSATTMRHQENRTSRLYTYRATDPERRAVSWSVTGTHARFFTIDAQRGELYFSETSPPDYENPQGSGTGGHEYQVTVQASDGSLSGTLAVTVTITDSNEGPEVTSGGDTFAVPENQELSGASFTASDPEGGEVTRWSLGGRDGGDFTIDENGLMTFRNLPDYERPADSDRNNIYEVEVRPYDGRHYGSHQVTVIVTPVNEAPAITTTSSSATTMRHPENRASRLYTYRATDPERGSIAWSVGGSHARFFTINDRGELYFSETTPPDFENPQGSGTDGHEYQVVVQASDDSSPPNTASLEVTVTVTDVNEGPAVTSGGDAFTVQENRNWAGATFGASDPEGGTISRWSLGGRDGGDFAITESGVMTFRRTPDFERPDDADRDNTYEVEVRPFDGRYYGSHAVTVTVDDVGEVSGAANITRAENFEGALAAYTAGGRGDLAVDPAWRLTGTDGGDFTIDESGQLAFRNIPDHERPADGNRDNVYSFTVQATDDRYYGLLDVTVTVSPVNEAPAITTTSASATTMRHPENRATRLYTYRATDPERGSITWSVAGAHARFFTIDAQRGELYFSDTTPPNYENPQGSGADGHEYQVTVQASDDENNTASLEVNVTITDVNEGPEISRSGSLQETVAENQAQDTVLARYTATDPEDTTAAITRWSTSGRDGGDFVISESGELRFRNSPDFERPADSDRDNVYEVTIRASDGRYTGTLEETQTVTVTNVNEAPVITTKSRTEFTQRENTASVLYTYRATDPDREDVITWSVEGADGGDFAIYNGILGFRLLPDFELPADSGGDNVYNITIVATDSGGLRDTVDATVTVTEVNEGPKVSGTTAFTVVEGQDLVGASFTANDQEGDAVTRWSLSGSDGGDFTISEFGEMTFRNLPDYDRPADSNRDNIYLVSVRAYDSGNRYGSLDVRVTVTDVNEEAPVVTGRQTLTFRENTPITQRLYTYRATDTDLNTTFTWSVGGVDGNDFAIEGGVLTFSSPPDYEQPADQDTDNVYEIAIVASDGATPGELPVTVTVTEVNEGPEISGTALYTVNELQSVTRNVDIAGATFTATDPEEDDVTRWSLTGTDGGDFTITDTSGTTGRNTADLAFRNPPDVDRPADSNRDNEYLVTIRAYDRRGQYGSYDVTVTVTGANEPPVITGSNARTFRENGTGAIYTYRATDPERDEFTWIEPGGADGSLFEVSDRGVLSFRDPPDFDIAGDDNGDNDYQVTVQARDNQGNIGAFEVTVTVTDINEGPEVSGREAISVQEYTDPTLDPQTQTLATYTAVDPEGSDITRWTLSGSDGGDFLISENGELTFRYAPDYDRPADSNRDNEYLVSVRAYDATNRYGSLEVTVTVGGENEAAPVVTGSQSLTFRENTPITQRLYAYRATDADRNTTFTWSVRGRNASDDGDAFAISDIGVLTFSSPPNHERPTDADTDNKYLLEIVATDDQGSEGVLEVTVTVTDLNEGPEPTGATEYTVAEGGSLTGATFTARDPDPGEGEAAVTGWRLAGPDAGDFNIGPTGTYTAQLTFRATPDFDRPADGNRDNEYLVTVRAYNGNTYGELEVMVSVTDQNEAEPVLTGRDTLSFRENTATDTRLHTYRATDMDRATTIIWSVEGSDGGDFVIEAGVLTFSSPPDYENPADSDTDNIYDITVVASDGANRATLDVTVTVTNVNEGPEVTGQNTRTVAENFDQVLATYTAVDPEGSAVTRWTLGGADSGDFTITDTGQEGGPYTAELTFRNPPDHDRPADGNRDNEYLVTVRPYDGRVYGIYEVTITVTSDNEPPVITGRDSLSFRENTPTATRLYTYRATDPEGDDFTWSLGGQDAGRFAISDAGVLTFSAAPDFESPPRADDNDYQVTVRATDDQGGIGTFAVTVTVTDQNEGPEVSGQTARSVSENFEGVLATYTATDPEDPTADITRWSVAGRDGGDFTINEDGELTFRNSPDHERPADANRDNIYEVTVRASDGRYYGTLDVVVTVNAVDEAPEFRSNSTDTFTYQENGTKDLYTYRATDPEGNDITWALSGSDSSAFEISETGVLSFADPPDYEDPTDSGSNNVYQVTVEAKDDEGNTASLAVTVTVTNVTD